MCGVVEDPAPDLLEIAGIPVNDTNAQNDYAEALAKIWQ
jgi:hypothetical protein